MQLPARPIFVDVETTGLHGSDRVVSLGAILLDTATLRQPEWDVQAVHLVFDPGKKSHPRAEAVHGWSDWMLRHQDPFHTHVDTLADLFARSDRIIAHNASFDWRFISSEFQLAGRPAPTAVRFCTMVAWRDQVGGRAGLNNVLAQMGLRRASEKHGAFEDAWFAMQVFLRLHGLPQPAGAIPLLAPTNQRDVPPLPEGPLPRRRKRSKLPAAVAAVPEGRTGTRAELIVATKAMATLLMWVAHSDGAVAEELAVLEAMLRDEASHRGIRVDDATLQDVAAALAEMQPTEAMVDVAARAILRDEGARQRLGNWIKLTTYADGQGSDQERLAIAGITEALARARRR